MIVNDIISPAPPIIYRGVVVIDDNSIYSVNDDDNNRVYIARLIIILRYINLRLKTIVLSYYQPIIAWFFSSQAYVTKCKVNYTGGKRYEKN